MSAQKKLIIGLSGTNGSGKDTVAQMLAERHGFLSVSATDMLAEELKKRNLPTDRKHKSELSAEWRRQYGMAAIVDRAYERFIEHKDKFSGLIVGSLRHPGEVERIHELGGSLIWVDADPRIRYERVTKNAHLRGRVAEDQVSYEDFIEQEQREMHQNGDAATLHVAAVKERADIFINNEENSVEQFKDKVEKLLGF